MTAIFISDLHLCASRPEILRSFLGFLDGPAREADTLCVLGDLFEYWIGDDDLGDPFNASVASAFASCAQAGTEILLTHGNRDFLLGEKFAQAANVRLISDPHLMTLDGTATLLMHGDTLCTDDRDYQRFREEIRAPAWRERFLFKPLTERKSEVEALRRKSETEKKKKTQELMDVNSSAVAIALRAHGYPRLIHGHTHRPARHEHLVDGKSCERWVLGDWYDSGSYLRCDERGLKSIKLS